MGVTRVGAVDKATFEAIPMGERTGHSHGNWSRPSVSCSQGEWSSSFQREAELRRCLNKKATQDRPLNPSIEAIHGAEAADEPNLREEDRLPASMAAGGELSVSSGLKCEKRRLYSEGTSLGHEATFKEGGGQPSPKASHSISMWSSSRKAEKVPI